MIDDDDDVKIINFLNVSADRLLCAFVDSTVRSFQSYVVSLIEGLWFFIPTRLLLEFQRASLVTFRPICPTVSAGVLFHGALTPNSADAI